MKNLKVLTSMKYTVHMNYSCLFKFKEVLGITIFFTCIGHYSEYRRQILSLCKTSNMKKEKKTHKKYYMNKVQYFVFSFVIKKKCVRNSTKYSINGLIFVNIFFSSKMLKISI